MARTGGKKISELESVSQLDDKDEFLFYQNSTGRTKKITTTDMLTSRGATLAIQGLGIGGDGTIPATPTGLTLTTGTERDRDGTEKVYIKATINDNAESDLESYGWSIRRASGTPVFDGNGDLIGVVGDLATSTSYGGTAQVFSAVTNVSQAPAGKNMMWDNVRANVYYEIRVCAIDKSGNLSSYTPLNNTTIILSAKDNTPPAAPTSVVASSAIRTVFLDWVNPTDSDLEGIKIYRNTSDNFGSSTLVATIYATSWTDSSTVQGQTYYYWLTAVDFSGNESASPSTVVSVTPGQVQATDIATFAVEATKLNTNTIILQGAVWTDNSNNGTPNSAAGYIHWNSHTVVYQGNAYTITAGSTNNKYVYWIYPNTVYATSDTNPNAATLGDNGFVIATNVGSDGLASGLHDLAWNALANALIGTAWIQNAAITNAKISELNADKIRTGSITSQTITLDGAGILKSSGASSYTSGSGFWLEGGIAPKFGIGDLSGTDGNGAYLKWSTGTLYVSGEIRAASGFFGTSTNNVLIRETGLDVGTSGRICSANIDWVVGTQKFTTSQNGFFLGNGSGTYRFFIGKTGTSGDGTGENSLYWDGAALKMRGVIYGGTTIDTNPSGVDGLIINSTIGIRKGNKTGTLTITGGDGNGIAAGAQIDFGGNELADGDRGTLILQGGSVGNSLDNGRIEFRTNTFNGTTGVVRGSFRTNGEFIVYRNSSQGGTYTDGAGCGQFNGNLSVGRSFANSTGGSTGKLHAQTEVAVYGTSDAQKVILAKTGNNTNEGVIYIKNDGGTTKITLDSSNGDVEADSFTTASSKRLKKKIKNLKNGLNLVKSLRPVTFDWKDNKKQNDFGLIAEEVNEILPIIVGKNKDGQVSGLDYSKLSAILIQAVKELSIELERLKNKIK